MREISYKDLSFNPMDMIANEWWLITAGNKDRGYNTMTGSWGHLGSIWAHGCGAPTAVMYIRPQRFTKEFVDREDFFTLSVFDEKYKKQLAYLGRHSGRDSDKISEAGLTPLFIDDTAAFEEAKLILVCRKVYHSPILESGFVDKSYVDEYYPDRDFHELYIGEIVKVMIND